MAMLALGWPSAAVLGLLGGYIAGNHCQFRKNSREIINARLVCLLFTFTNDLWQANFDAILFAIPKLCGAQTQQLCFSALLFTILLK